MMITSNTVILF